MSRFYQTSDPNFVDNFIFQPNWDLAAMALQKKDNLIGEQLDTLDFYGNPMFDFDREADGIAVDEFKQAWQDKIEDITRQVGGDLMNTSKTRKLIGQAKRELEKEFETGQISKFQDNAKRISEYLEKAGAMENVADQELYRNIVADYRTGAEGRGSSTALFNGPSQYANKGYTLNEFAKSDTFKALEAEVDGTIRVNDKGRWIVTKGNTTKELPVGKVEEAYKGWVNSNADISGLAGVRSKYAGENWFDETGNLSFAPGTILGNQLQAAGRVLPYRDSRDTEKWDMNPYTMMYEKDALDRKNKELEAQEALIGADVDAKGAARTADEVRLYNQRYLDGYLKELYLKQNNLPANAFEEYQKNPSANGGAAFAQGYNNFLKTVNVNSLYDFVDKYKDIAPTIAGKAQQQINHTESIMRGSYSYLGTKYGIPATAIDRWKTSTRDYVDKHSGTMTFTFMDDDVRKTKAATAGIGKKQEDLVGKAILVAGKKQPIVRTEIIKGTADPVILNAPEINGQNINDNIGVAVMRVYYDDRDKTPTTENQSKYRTTSSDDDYDLPYVDRKVYYSLQEVGLDNRK